MTAGDLDLLRQYAAQKSEGAFAELVDRHLNLVYSAALRQVRSPQLAEEVAQAVFVDLSRNAAKLRPDTILTVWLYSITRRTAIDTVRKESRRQLREQIATEMNAMNATADDWMHIEPLLDDAMDTLDGVDRTAILLRYFENKSFREVGQQLGISDDAAQKRVTRAVERLRQFLAKRGVPVGAGALAMIISVNAIQAAPVGLALAISAAVVLTGTAVSTSTAIAMTTLQKTLVTATIAVLAGGGIYEARQVARLGEQNQALRQQQATLAGQIQQLQHEREEMTNKLAGLGDENAASKTGESELLRLRSEVTRLKSRVAELENDPAEATARAWVARVNQLKRYLEQNPKARIPELQFVTEEDWYLAAKYKLESDDDYRRALASLRGMGSRVFVDSIFTALKEYLKANRGQFPTDVSQIVPYAFGSMDRTILDRWQILPRDSFSCKSGVEGEWVITQKPTAAVDAVFDSRYLIATNTWTSGASFNQPLPLDEAQVLENALAPLMNAYSAANNGQTLTNPTQLAPYATNAEQQALLSKAVHIFQARAPDPGD